MRKFKKSLALTMCATIMMSSSVLAADIKQIDSDRFYPGSKWTTQGDDKTYQVPSSFSKAWEYPIQWEFTESGVAYNACMAVVGFDTWCTNEDYIKNVCGSASGYYVCGAVKNSEGKWSGDTTWGSSNKNSNKKDVKHTGTKVTYWLGIGVKQ